MTAFTWLGSFDAANHWKPFAEAQLNQMKRLGLPLKRTYFVENAEISIQLNPPLIHIKAVSNLLFTIDGFNILSVVFIIPFNDQLVIAGAALREGEEYGISADSRFSGFIALVDKDYSVDDKDLLKNAISIDAPVYDSKQRNFIAGVATDDTYIYVTSFYTNSSGIAGCAVFKIDKLLNIVDSTFIESTIFGVTANAITVNNGDIYLGMTDAYAMGTQPFNPPALLKLNSGLTVTKKIRLYPGENYPFASHDVDLNIEINTMRFVDGKLVVAMKGTQSGRVLTFDANLNYIKDIKIQGFNLFAMDADDNYIYIGGSVGTTGGAGFTAVMGRLDLNLNLTDSLFFSGERGSRIAGITVQNRNVYACGRDVVSETPEETVLGYQDGNNALIMSIDSDFDLVNIKQVDEVKDGSFISMIADDSFLYAVGTAYVGLTHTSNETTLPFTESSIDGMLSKWDKSLTGQGKIQNIKDIVVKKSNIKQLSSPPSFFTSQEYTEGVSVLTQSNISLLVEPIDLELTGGAF